MSTAVLQKSLIALLTLLAAHCITLRPGIAVAGIMLEGVLESDYIAYSNQSQFDAIGNFATGASGTLIAPNWVLTAAHLGTGVDGFRVRGSGTSYSVAQVIQHPTWILNGGDINRGFDLQLVRLATPVVGVTPATIYRGSNETGLTASITGFGGGGFGNGGTTLGSRQRAGTNVIDAVISLTNGAQNAMLISDFDSGAAQYNTLEQSMRLPATTSSPIPTSLEYHLAGGDSGGGVYVFENGLWYLAGVNSGVEHQREFLLSNDTNYSNNAFGYGAISFFTRVSAFTSFIDSQITAVPEPSSVAMVTFAGFALTAGRIRRRKREAV